MKLIVIGLIALAIMGALGGIYYTGYRNGAAKELALCEAHIQTSIDAARMVDAQIVTDAINRAEAGKRAADARAEDERLQADAYLKELESRANPACAMDPSDYPRLRSRF